MIHEVNDKLFAGKVVFVAGGTSGINLGIAQSFLACGARVAVLSRSSDKVDAAVKTLHDMGGEAIGFAADVREFDAVRDAFAATEAAFGKADVIVSGAAGNFPALAENMSSNAFRSVVDIDLIGTFNVLRSGFDHLNRNGASIVNISAPQSVMPSPMQSHVCAAKAGIDQLTRCLAIEWGPYGTRVNAILPGPIEGTEGMLRLAPTEQHRAAIEQALPLRRYGTKQEVADLALFLSSPSAKYITGAVIPCDGGLCASGGRS